VGTLKEEFSLNTYEPFKMSVMNYACEHYWRNVIKLEALLLIRKEIY
jgi:hypothetical protein